MLPGYPYSGQPKIDMEADWASFSQSVGLPSEEEGEDRQFMNDDRVTMPQVLSRDRSLGVLSVAMFWVIFLLLASLYVVEQIEAVEEYYDDEDGRSAWLVFWIVLGGGVPLVACLGNWVRWKVYERWILMSGSKKKAKKSKKKMNTGGDDGMEDEVGSYVQMT